MAGYTETKFVKQYEPGNQARVELVNGRIVDVVHGRYYETGTRVVLQDGKIVSIVDKVYPMEKAIDAHRRVESEQRLGAVVIAIGDL